MATGRFDFARMPEFLEEWVEGSDRSTGIMTGALLDEMLRRLLERAVVQGMPSDECAVPSQFAPRINLAYAMGLISDEEYHDLRLVKKIRNHFAHHIDQPYTFETPIIREKVFASVLNDLYKERKNLHYPPELELELKNVPRTRFEQSTGILYACLLEHLNTQESKAPPPVKFTFT